MKILIACKEFPHSKIIGGPIIIYNRLKYLSRNHVVSLAAFFREEEKDLIPSVEGFCHDMKLVPFPPKRSAIKATSEKIHIIPSLSLIVIPLKHISFNRSSLFSSKPHRISIFKASRV
jgi:hypothetical protein